MLSLELIKKGNKQDGRIDEEVDILESVVKVTKRYSELRNEPLYKRHVITVQDLQGKPIGHSILHYFFEGGKPAY